jgi:hypothetical protein
MPMMIIGVENHQMVKGLLKGGNGDDCACRSKEEQDQEENGRFPSPPRMRIRHGRAHHWNNLKKNEWDADYKDEQG